MEIVKMEWNLHGKSCKILGIYSHTVLMAILLGEPRSAGTHAFPSPLIPLQPRDNQVARALRSTTAPLFYRPFVSTVFASQAFYYSAPQVWNCLGTSTRSANTFSSFMRCLKSELFAAAYDT